MTPLEQALVVRAIRAGRGHGRGVLVGAELAALRRAIAAGEHDRHPARRTARRVEEAIRAVDQASMPPDAALVGTLVEALAARLDAVGVHAGAWRAIGVRPGRGRDLLARQAHAVDWPLWRTLRDAALDGLELAEPTDTPPNDSPAPGALPRRGRAETQLELPLPDPSPAPPSSTRGLSDDAPGH